ncbi:MAG TPA: fructosamine kinase family protein [Anaerolineales bacterium]|nr:fructosamine kinase family protein [Anaerolineales bacterium]
MIPANVQAWLEEKGYGEVRQSRAVGGGCISNGARLVTQSGETFFLKTNTHTPQDMFAREAEGLQALRGANGPRTPEPYLWGADFLLLEDLNPAARQADYWLAFGRQLAALHACTADAFGFENDNYIGSTPQPNRRRADGYAFFANERLGFQARLAQRKGLLSKEQAQAVYRLAEGLPEWIPEQPASLIHGDLWSGNAIADEQGQPALIDPAAYYGWAEAELAMTALFGGFPAAFYDAYQEARPLQPGWRERFPLYNLYHLLNHLNLFGGGYLGQVLAILRKFAG